MKHLINKIFLTLSAFSPSFVFAQSLSNSTFKDIIISVLSVFAILNPILFALAFVVFFWGLTRFILHSGGQADLDKGKNYMFWGIIALFILVSFRAIVAIIGTDLGLGGGSNILLPVGP